MNLVGCNNLVISPTPTPSATQTIIPTTPTQIPTPTEIPLPEGIIAELRLQLTETGYDIVWDKEDKAKLVLIYTDPITSEKSVVPELKFDETGAWARSYTFSTPYETQEEVTIDSRVDKLKVVKQDEAIVEYPGGVRKVEKLEETIIFIDFSGWRLEKGKWVREYEQGEPHYNVAETQSMLVNNGSQDPQDSFGVELKDYEGKALWWSYKNALFPGIAKVNGVIKYNNLTDIIDTSRFSGWWANDIKTVDNSGNPLFIDTTFYANIYLLSGNCAIIYKDRDRKYQIIFIDSELWDLRNWSPYFIK
jgi:hypothetical protein